MTYTMDNTLQCDITYQFIYENELFNLYAE